MEDLDTQSAVYNATTDDVDFELNYDESMDLLPKPPSGTASIKSSISASIKKSKNCFFKIIDAIKWFFLKTKFFWIISIYSVLGALLFMWLEVPTDLKSKEEQKDFHLVSRDSLLFKIKQIHNENMGDMEYKWKQAILQFEENMGLEVPDPESTAWTFWMAILYAGTIYTTIGYGNIACATGAGRLASVCYALIGIPLMLVILDNLGDFLLKVVKKCNNVIEDMIFLIGVKSRLMRIESEKSLARYAKMSRKLRFLGFKSIPNSKASSQVAGSLNGSVKDHFSKEVPYIEVQSYCSTTKSETVIDMTKVNEAVAEDAASSSASGSNSEEDDNTGSEEDRKPPLLASIIITIGWILASAGVFCLWEDWTYSTSVYFFFISTSTIGFGDVTPDHPEYMIATFGVVIVGLSLVSVCINVVQEWLVQWYTNLLNKMLEQYIAAQESGDENAAKGFMTGLNAQAKYLMPLLSKSSGAKAMEKFKKEATKKGVELPSALTEIDPETGKLAFLSATDAEIDQIIEKAQSEGKLTPAPISPVRPTPPPVMNAVQVQTGPITGPREVIATQTDLSWAYFEAREAVATQTVVEEPPKVVKPEYVTTGIQPEVSCIIQYEPFESESDNESEAGIPIESVLLTQRGVVSQSQTQTPRRRTSEAAIATDPEVEMEATPEVEITRLRFLKSRGSQVRMPGKDFGAQSEFILVENISTQFERFPGVPIPTQTEPPTTSDGMAQSEPSLRLIETQTDEPLQSSTRIQTDSPQLSMTEVQTETYRDDSAIQVEPEISPAEVQTEIKTFMDSSTQSMAEGSAALIQTEGTMHVESTAQTRPACDGVECQTDPPPIRIDAGDQTQPSSGEGVHSQTDSGHGMVDVGGQAVPEGEEIGIQMTPEMVQIGGQTDPPAMGDMALQADPVEVNASSMQTVRLVRAMKTQTRLTSGAQTREEFEEYRTRMRNERLEEFTQERVHEAIQAVAGKKTIALDTEEKNFLKNKLVQLRIKKAKQLKDENLQVEFDISDEQDALRNDLREFRHKKESIVATRQAMASISSIMSDDVFEPEQPDQPDGEQEVLVRRTSSIPRITVSQSDDENRRASAPLPPAVVDLHQETESLTVSSPTGEEVTLNVEMTKVSIGDLGSISAPSPMRSVALSVASLAPESDEEIPIDEIEQMIDYDSIFDELDQEVDDFNYDDLDAYAAESEIQTDSSFFRTAEIGLSTEPMRKSIVVQTEQTDVVQTEVQTSTATAETSVGEALEVQFADTQTVTAITIDMEIETDPPETAESSTQAVAKTISTAVDSGAPEVIEAESQTLAPPVLEDRGSSPIVMQTVESRGSSPIPLQNVKSRATSPVQLQNVESRGASPMPLNVESRGSSPITVPTVSTMAQSTSSGFYLPENPVEGVSYLRDSETDATVATVDAVVDAVVTQADATEQVGAETEEVEVQATVDIVNSEAQTKMKKLTETSSQVEPPMNEVSISIASSLQSIPENYVVEATIPVFHVESIVITQDVAAQIHAVFATRGTQIGDDLPSTPPPAVVERTSSYHSADFNFRPPLTSSSSSNEINVEFIDEQEVQPEPEPVPEPEPEKEPSESSDDDGPITFAGLSSNPPWSDFDLVPGEGEEGYVAPEDEDYDEEEEPEDEEEPTTPTDELTVKALDKNRRERMMEIGIQTGVLARVQHLYGASKSGGQSSVRKVTLRKDSYNDPSFGSAMSIASSSTTTATGSIAAESAREEDPLQALPENERAKVLAHHGRNWERQQTVADLRSRLERASLDPEHSAHSDPHRSSSSGRLQLEESEPGPSGQSQSESPSTSTEPKGLQRRHSMKEKRIKRISRGDKK
uniref:Ion_trans_2 domain-containing protein n=1 Tax=Panagrellus redivivus TaxID=6233 RepID=A0A7E4UUM8_PANRE